MRIGCWELSFRSIIHKSRTRILPSHFCWNKICRLEYFTEFCSLKLEGSQKKYDVFLLQPFPSLEISFFLKITVLEEIESQRLWSRFSISASLRKPSYNHNTASKIKKLATPWFWDFGRVLSTRTIQRSWYLPWNRLPQHKTGMNWRVNLGQPNDWPTFFRGTRNTTRKHPPKKSPWNISNTIPGMPKKSMDQNSNLEKF